MFDLVRMSDYGLVPVPLPGRAILFCDAEGHLRAKLHDGSVLPVEAGAGVAFAGDLSAGSLALISRDDPSLRIDIGQAVVTNGSNYRVAQYAQESTVGYVWLPSGQVWRLLGFISTTIFLALRVS